MKLDALVWLSYQGQSSSIDAEDTINLMLEHVESGQSKNTNQYVFLRSPGLRQLLATGKLVGRALFPLNGHVFAAFDDTIYDVIVTAGVPSINATYTPIANDGTGRPVEMCASPTQLLVESLGHTYVIQTGSLTEISQFGTPISSIGFINQFFLFLDGTAGDGFYFSEPGDATTGTNLNFISAEADANKFIKLIVDRRGNIWLFGTRVTQGFFDNSASDPTNPFAPIQSAAGLPYGTIAKDSCIEWANGWVGWLSRDVNGLGMAVATQGGLQNVQRVSNHAVEYIWSTYPTLEDAISYALMIKGHPLWRIFFPSANATWEYDPTVGPKGDWRKVLYYNATIGKYEAHRVRCACSEFGAVLGADRSNGKLYKMSLDYYDDDLANGGARIRWMRKVPVISNEKKLVGLPWIELDIQAGVGNGTNLDPALGTVTPEAEPQIELRISRDSGNSYGAPRPRSMGQQGDYSHRPIWVRNGMGRQTVLEFTGDAAVPMIINNCYLRNPDGRTT